MMRLLSKVEIYSFMYEIYKNIKLQCAFCIYYYYFGNLGTLRPLSQLTKRIQKCIHTKHILVLIFETIMYQLHKEVLRTQLTIERY